MKSLFKSWILRALALMMVASGTLAQDRVPFRQEELDQMLAPVALYPDAVLSQILMAATYPLEVVQAARWSRANSALKGDDAVRAVERMDWDASVKALTAFPQILHMMDERLEWTERLGEAFLAMQADVMATVQDLRQRADAAGNLESSDRMRVTRESGAITIQPPAPETVYVPYYDPRVVYGPWWWSDYPPVYWAPPRAYYVVPAYPSPFFWGSGIWVAPTFFFGHMDWHRRHVTVVHRHVTVVTPGAAPRHPEVWRHNPHHRRGVPFRNSEARVRYEEQRAATGETRRYAPPERREPAVNRPVPNNTGDRVPSTPTPIVRSVEPPRPAPPPEARYPHPNPRAERNGTARVQPRSAPPQPAVIAPPTAPAPGIARPEQRPAPVAQTPVAKRDNGPPRGNAKGQDQDERGRRTPSPNRDSRG